MTVNVSKPALNVREKLAELDKPTGIAGEAMLRAETPQEQFNLIGAGRRNVIINGNFQISQRGDYSSATAISNVTYYLDRWTALVAGNTANLTHTGNRARITASASSSAGRYGLRQTIEHESWMAGKWWTISAKVKSNTSNAFVYVYTDDGIVARTEKHSGNGQDEVLTATFYAASDNTTMQVYVRVSDDDGFTVNVLSGDYIEVTEVQLELGKVATPFEHRSYGEELALCQRYYQKGTYYDRPLICSSSASAYGGFDLPVEMRVSTPTYYFSEGSYFYVNGVDKVSSITNRNIIMTGDANYTTFSHVRIIIQNSTSAWAAGNVGICAGYWSIDCEL